MDNGKLTELIEAVQQAGEALRITAEFYQLVALQLHEMYQVNPELRPEIIIGAGNENVQLIGGVWTFVPSS